MEHPVTPLTDEQVASFDEGYCVVEGLLDDAEIASLKADIDSVVGLPSRLGALGRELSPGARGEGCSSTSTAATMFQRRRR